MACQIELNIGDNLVVTCTGDTVLETVELAADFSEFPTVCKCGSKNLGFKVRRPQEGAFTYYGMACRDCRREFSFGQTKTGKRLFPKWKEGWLTYEEQMANKAAGQPQHDYPPSYPPQGGQQYAYSPQGGQHNAYPPQQPPYAPHQQYSGPSQPPQGGRATVKPHDPRGNAPDAIDF